MRYPFYGISKKIHPEFLSLQPGRCWKQCLKNMFHCRWAGYSIWQLSFEIGLKRNYWMRNKRGSTAEVDFIVVYDGKIIPIEVKSGHNAHLKSIHQFMNDTSHDIAIRIWSGTYSVDKVKTVNGKEFRLINLPFYLISALPHILTDV